MGTGRPLVLIHGFGCYWTLAQNQCCGRWLPVFALDLLGFGGSDKPALITPGVVGGTTQGFLDGTHSGTRCICGQFDWHR